MSFTLIFENKKEEKDLKEDRKIKDILSELDVYPETTIVKRNGELADDESLIKEGDEIHIIQIVYGG
ncbi:MoaD/ThiS family protein [Methanobrevibacter sp. TMH8]|uniref:MoaD/ThiS family protein n=1 Tax=Methanobrevibacter sp. TMH8 TaxID=2848611 RepID=UPI001CCE830D|nr:MoaD/ThiS family protein [Methanobrevibacter sp. TMH8]MBZ9570871.1 MoaD/ThiS family protein [Methanobrevibacter sp. TMH8]